MKKKREIQKRNVKKKQSSSLTKTASNKKQNKLHTTFYSIVNLIGERKFYNLLLGLKKIK